MDKDSFSNIELFAIGSFLALCSPLFGAISFMVLMLFQIPNKIKRYIKYFLLINLLVTSIIVYYLFFL